jgi:outer membrane protein OmpA-like peptidoglycan-associated protein
LKDAEDSINKVKTAEQSGKEKETVEHYQYIAQKKLDLAGELAKQKRAEAKIAGAELNRKDALLTSKTQKLEEANAQVDVMSTRLSVAEQEAQKAIEHSREMEAKANAMAKKLKNISVSNTERGLVITMGSILFEVNEATLKPDAQNTVARIAELLKEYPDRNVMIEGFTDSSGTESYNLDLSEKRAQQVKLLLSNDGVASKRLDSVGYGESYPAASNDTNLGRQKNRRVELVIANTDMEAVQQRSK